MRWLLPCRISVTAFVSLGLRWMKTSWYIVIESLGQWWVDHEGRSLGPVATKQEAGLYARRVAEVFGDRTVKREVWEPDEDGKLQLVWSLGPEQP